MAQLTQLRQKIRSIQTTKKITHAIRLVSMSLYNKLDKLDAPLKNYTKNVKNLFIQLMSNAPQWKNSLLFPGDVLDKAPLYIIIATSKGLCGSLNSNLLRYLDSSLFIEKQQEPKFIAIGLRAIKVVKEKELGELVCSYAELSSNNFIAIADDLVDKIVHSSKHYSSVTFYSNHSVSFFTQKPGKMSLIPMSLEPLHDQEKNSNQIVEEQPEQESDLIWEQDDAQVLNYLSIRYLRSSIIHILFQALRAEHAARFLAMESSTNNAEKYLERLTLQLNKLRQAMITKEVSELSSGFPSR